MKDFYVIAKKDLEPNLPHSTDWPKIIAYSYEDEKLLFLAGKGHGISGFELPASETGASDWTDLFLELNATWIPDLLKNSNFSCLDDFLKSLKKLNIPIEKMQA
ncbi:MULTISPECIES: hypothetical protein [Pseudomonas]|uniref:hypothetical protein n=1 Tax=Pseudomonas TaxID=286 RepID=UPI000F55E5F8|nr:MULTISPECIES: hypothetical protein [Pseudomonas]KAB0525670.1 hypothetical protein F7R16_27935 [Pseudomonas chlororaphis subsp. aureofaciens]TSD30141.1 hypothetical protein FCE86_011365 [Pseudomonas sp. ATCC 13985]WDG48609.1 hypothetical protein PUP58_02190 [Pseudomonas chlororaphis]WDG60758.1 hypothetical protein PUP52_02190 [Pseudomonas chlororaphis]WDG66968.1 hypothetical protein PUP59_02190 [Pseudomonas chlororaphis]